MAENEPNPDELLEQTIQQLTKLKYASELGPRTFEHLYRPSWIRSIARDQLGLEKTEEDEANIAQAKKKLKAFRNLPQDRDLYEAIDLEVQQMEERTQRRAAAMREDPNPLAVPAWDEGRKDLAQREETRGADWARKQQRVGAAALAGFPAEMTGLPREYSPQLHATLGEWGKSFAQFMGVERELPSRYEDREDLPWTGFSLRQWFGPRNASPRQKLYLLQHAGVPAKEVWDLDLTYPDSGDVVQMEDGTYHYYDAPEVDTGDILEFAGTEAFPLLFDILLTKGKSKELSTFMKGDIPSALSALARGAKLGAYSGLGTGIGEGIRIAGGKALDTHDMSWEEAIESVLYETVIAGGSAALMLGAFKGLSMVRNLVDPQPLAGWSRPLIEGIAAWERQNNQAFPWINDSVRKRFPEFSQDESLTKFFQDHPESLQELNQALKDLGVKRKPGEKDIYHSSLGRETGVEEALRVESELLALASSNPALANVFKQHVLRNNEVAMTMLERMHKGEFPKDINADDLAKQIAEELGFRADEATAPYLATIEAAERSPAERFAQQIGETYREADLEVPGLWKRKSTEEFFEPPSTGGAQLLEDIKLQPREALKEALGREEYQGGVELSEEAQSLFKNWLRMGKREGDEIFIDPRVVAAKDEIFKLVPMSKNAEGELESMLARLAGETRYPKLDPTTGKQVLDDAGNPVYVELEKLGALTLDQLNGMRKILNYMVGTPDVVENVGLRNIFQQTKKQLGKEIGRLFRQQASVRSGHPPDSPANAQWMKDNDFGEDVRRAWEAERQAIEVSKYSITQMLQKQDPSRFMHNLLQMYRNVGKSDLPDRELKELVANLERIGRHEDLRDIRGVVVDYISKGLSDTETTALQKNQDYRKFFKEHTPFLKALFPFKEFGNLKTLPKFLKGAAETVEENTRLAEEIKNQFKPRGEEGGRRIRNIVSDFLNDAPDKSADKWQKDVDEYVDLIKDSPSLQEETKQVAWNWLLTDENKGILVPGPFGPGTLVIDPQRLENILRGFRVGSDTHTLEHYFGRLLGEEGRQYVGNLRKLNRIVQQESTIPPALRGAAEASQFEPQTRFLERMFIAPLTIFGRRTTALRGRLGDRAQLIAANALYDPDLLGKIVRTQNRRLTLSQWISALTAWERINNLDVLAEDPDQPLDPEAEVL
jgi:hypothetical protein